MNRLNSLHQLRESSTWDVLIVGGGATGLGAAVESAARGYRTALVEQADFAQATSSRSTKLIHGGVRYLEQGNLGLVREALHERALLLENAPGLVWPIPLAVPLSGWIHRFYLTAGFRLYDALAGKRRLQRMRHLSKEELAERLPGFAGPAPKGGLLFYDAQFDDARLAIALARTFAKLDGTPLNYARVTGLRKRAGKLSGAQIRDEETGEEFEIEARVVINATGVFTDRLRRLDQPGAPPMIQPSQGAHLVLPSHFLAGDTGILIPRTEDGRVLFALPWQGRVLLGTTDTPITETPLEPKALPEEIDFLLQHAERHLGWRIATSDVLSAFAGLRPLVKTNRNAATAALSRDHLIDISPAGLVTIAGGKWTTYRRMGEAVINAAAPIAHLPVRASQTKHLHLEQSPSTGDPILNAIREEMARTVEDILSRRTRALLLDARAASEQAPQVAAILATELNRDPTWEANQIATFQTLARQYQL